MNWKKGVTHQHLCAWFFPRHVNLLNKRNGKRENSPTILRSFLVSDPDHRTWSIWCFLPSGAVIGGHDMYTVSDRLRDGCHILSATTGRLKDMVEKARVSSLVHLDWRRNFSSADFFEKSQILRFGRSRSVGPSETLSLAHFTLCIPECWTPALSPIFANWKSSVCPRKTSVSLRCSQPHSPKKYKNWPNTSYAMTTSFSLWAPSGVRTKISLKLLKKFHNRTRRIVSFNYWKRIWVKSKNRSETKKDFSLWCFLAEDERCLIFVETKRSADYIGTLLSQKKFMSTTMHGDRSQKQRQEAVQQFTNGKCPVLVATSVAARGLDFPLIGYVVNFDLPDSSDFYVHRIGRTGETMRPVHRSAACFIALFVSGRAGHLGKSISFFDPDRESDRRIAPELILKLSEVCLLWRTGIKDRTRCFALIRLVKKYPPSFDNLPMVAFLAAVARDHEPLM